MDDGNVVFELKNFDTSTATLVEFRDLVRHLQEQMNDTYMYWVGEWANHHGARSTRDGKMVKNDDVIRYLS